MRIVCLSDTHDRHSNLRVPDGDVLVHAGDLTGRGSFLQVRAFDDWLGTLPHRHKLVIAGNHDFGFERDPDAKNWVRNAIYLQDSGVTLDGVSFWGSPWQPRFFDWAFNLDRGEAIRRRWDLIPAGTDVLITHGPPRGILDRAAHGEQVGCDDLRDAVFRVRPKLHVFGHIHEAAGQAVVDGVRFVNASICDVKYSPTHVVIVVDL